jgi:hypothetical protein
MQKKGCDASNIYDEEIPAEEQEHSDDEKEKEALPFHFLGQF